MSEPTCSGCRERDQKIALLMQQLAELQARVAQLEARLHQNSSNSSIPPSANPPSAPAPVTKKPSGRKPGAQPGHPGHSRQLLPIEQVHRVVLHIPTHCECCQTPLDSVDQPHDPPPTRHQVAELPPIRALVSEHQGHARTCSHCGHVTRPAIPEADLAHSIGPQLAATLSYLAGSHQVSRRGLQEIAEQVFGVEVSLGTVDTLQMQTSEALAAAHSQALQAVREAPVKNVDETGWKQAGKRCWLWVAATTTVAAYLIHAKRSRLALQALLGEPIVGILGTDRWSAYHKHPASRRQICWAHLQRDFQKHAEGSGVGQEIGTAGLKVVGRLFEQWEWYRGGGGSREELAVRMEPIQEELQGILRKGAGCTEKSVAKFCRNVQKVQEGLWLFVKEPGVEPTNNHAERLMRPAVLWRKNSYGSHSEAGCRLVERMLSVVQTLRLQQRQVLSFLTESIHALRTHQPAPLLLPPH